MFKIRRRKIKDKAAEDMLYPTVGPPYICGAAKYWIPGINKEIKEKLVRAKFNESKKNNNRRLFYKGSRIVEYKREPIGMGFVLTLETDVVKRISFKEFLTNVEDKSTLESIR